MDVYAYFILRDRKSLQVSKRPVRPPRYCIVCPLPPKNSSGRAPFEEPPCCAVMCPTPYMYGCLVHFTPLGILFFQGMCSFSSMLGAGAAPMAGDDSGVLIGFPSTRCPCPAKISDFFSSTTSAISLSSTLEAAKPESPPCPPEEAAGRSGS